MSRIVLCSREWSSSTGRYVRSLVENLQHIDKENEYFILMSSKDAKSWRPRNDNFHVVECDIPEYSFREQTTLISRINELKPDLVHFTMVQQPIFYTGKTITTMHDLTTLRFNNPSKNKIIFKIKQLVYGIVNKVAAQKSKKIICPTEYVKQDVVAYTGIDSSKIMVTYEAADKISEIAKKPSGLLNTKYFMYVGRPNPHKNLWGLILAFNQVYKVHPDYRLVLAGNKDELYQRLEDKTASLGIDGVQFVGRVDEGELKWLYENCEAYVFPSLSEGFGLPGLEAMKHGAPVISSDKTSLPEVYGDAALYFDPENTESMAISMNKIIEKPLLRKKMMSAGGDQVKKFSWKNMAMQTLDIYTDVINR